MHKTELYKLSIWVKKGNQIFLLISIYTLSWSPLLFASNSLYWDDWLYFKNSKAIISNFNQAGFPWIGWLHVNILGFNPIFYHVTSFLLFLFSGVLLHLMINNLPKKLFNLSKNEKFFISCLILILPINTARNALNILIYTICYFLFTLAWFLYTTITRKNLFVKSFIFLIFFLSFNLNSLLLFFLIPLLHKIFYTQSHQESQKIIKKFYAEKFYIFSPILFIILKYIFFQPFGLYEDYNKINFKFFVAGLIVLLFTLIALLLIYKSTHLSSLKSHSFFFILFIGIFCLVLSLLPYISIGYFPPYPEWSTRHEVLTPLGISLILGSLLRLLSAFRLNLLKYSVQILLIISCGVITFGTSLNYVVDWKKQNSILSYLKTFHSNQAYKNFLFDDSATEFNIFRRSYRHYEWTGMLGSSTGVNSNFGINATREDFDALINGSFLVSNELAGYSIPKFSEDFIWIEIMNKCTNPEKVDRRSPTFLLIMQDILSLIERVMVSRGFDALNYVRNYQQIQILYSAKESCLSFNSLTLNFEKTVSRINVNNS